MKKWIAVFGLLSVIIWTAPADYSNGTPLPSSILPNIVYRLYVDGAEFAQVKGVLKWEGTLPQQPGEVKNYTATAEIDGQAGTKSAPTDPVTFAWWIPLNRPGSVTIQLGN
jgi:hypothetical protein